MFDRIREKQRAGALAAPCGIEARDVAKCASAGNEHVLCSNHARTSAQNMQPEHMPCKQARCAHRVEPLHVGVGENARTRALAPSAAVQPDEPLQRRLKLLLALDGSELPTRIFRDPCAVPTEV